jgi:DNA-binding transcriptional LysR family regulator
MLDVRKLRMLRELARLGTIVAVADALSYTPSAVSQQLSSLERAAGVALLKRNGRRVELTPAGADLAERAGPVLALLEQASAALASARSEVVGELRIGAFPTAVRTLLPAALVALGAEHPKLELHVTELDPAGVPDALRAGTLDIALVHDYDYVPAAPDRALDTGPLLTETIFLAASRHAAALPEHSSAPWIVGSPGTLCHLMAVRLCQASGFTPRIRHYADDFAAVLALVAAGQGVALVPELALADCPDGVTLTALPARRRTLIACRAGAAGHPANAACAAALHSAAAAYLAGSRFSG